MKKTRVLAAILCVVMMATMLPMLHVSATTTTATYTLEQALDGAEIGYTANFTGFDVESNYRVDYYEKYFTVPEGTSYTATIYTGANLARLCDAEGGFGYPNGMVQGVGSAENRPAGTAVRLEKQAEDGALISKNNEGNEKVLSVDLTAEGLALRAGNNAKSNNDNQLPGLSQENVGWTWDNTTPGSNYDLLKNKLDIDTGYAGALLFKLKLTNDGSVATANLVEGAGGNANVGFRISTRDGLQMMNASNYAYGDGLVESSYVAEGELSTAGKYPVATGTWYEILLKNNANRYTLYAKAEGEDGFTKVVTGSAVGGNTVGSTTKKLELKVQYNTTGVRATELVTIDGVTKEYFADQYDTTDAGVTEIKDGNGSIPVSEVIFESITNYTDSTESGMTIEEAFGEDTVIATKADFDNAKTKELVGKRGLAAWGASTTGTYDSNGDMTLATSQKLTLNSILADGGVTENTAVELNYTMPSVGQQYKGVNIQGPTSNGRVYIDLGHHTEINEISLGGTKGILVRNARGANAERTLLITKKDGNMVYYVKNPVSGKYIYLGSDGVKTGSATEFTVTNNINQNFTINGFTVYKKNGVADSSALPEGVETMLKYVDEDFDSIDEPNYAKEIGGSGETTKGNVTVENGELVIARPDTSEAGASTYLNLQNAGIPKGGYAELGFRAETNRYFQIIADGGDGVSGLTIGVNADSNSLGLLSCNASTLPLSYMITPDADYDMRIFRNTDNTYTIYVKRAEENSWTKLFENIEAAERIAPSRFKVGGIRYYGSAVTDVDYVNYLKIYGVGEGPMTILDGNDYVQTTKILEEGSTPTYGIKAIVAEGDAKQLVFAGYDAGGKLVTTEPIEIDASESVSTISCGITGKKSSKIKVFLWDGFNKMKPLAPTKVFYLTPAEV